MSVNELTEDVTVPRKAAADRAGARTEIFWMCRLPSGGARSTGYCVAKTVRDICAAMDDCGVVQIVGDEPDQPGSAGWALPAARGR